MGGRILGALALASALIFASPGLAQSNDQSQPAKNDTETIQSLTDKWLEVAATGDVDGYMNLMTDDFIWLDSDTGAGYVGRLAVREFLEAYFVLQDGEQVFRLLEERG